MSPGLMRGDTGGLTNETYLSKPVVSSEQYLSGLKPTNWLFQVSYNFSQELLFQKIAFFKKANFSQLTSFAQSCPPIRKSFFLANTMSCFFTVAHTTLSSPKILYLKSFASKLLSQGSIKQKHLSENVGKFGFRLQY